jgi:hypothetical protein
MASVNTSHLSTKAMVELLRKLADDLEGGTSVLLKHTWTEHKEAGEVTAEYVLMQDTGVRALEVVVQGPRAEGQE